MADSVIIVPSSEQKSRNTNKRNETFHMFDIRYFISETLNINSKYCECLFLALLIGKYQSLIFYFNI